jgi:hypothetical protein
MLALEVKPIVSSMRRIDLVKSEADDPSQAYRNQGYKCCDEGKK